MFSFTFLILPTKIANTTIYYAACSLNYLYTTFIAILYGYLFFKDYQNNFKTQFKTKWWLVLLAFFTGASAQQTGMIGIGFTVIVTVYFVVIKKHKFDNHNIPYYFALLIGYAIVSFGSVKMILYEQSVGNSINIPETITSILTTSIFSWPTAPYVLITSLCILFWLYHYTVHQKTKLWNLEVIVNLFLGIALVMLTFVYHYALYAKISVNVFVGLSSLFFITYTLIYLGSLIYVSILILFREHSPFILFCNINAIGAQLMLIVADSRFAGSYKVFSPSLLLICIFIVFSAVKFHHSTPCRILKILIFVPIIIYAAFIYSNNYLGYKSASITQNYNLQKINIY